MCYRTPTQSVQAAAEIPATISQWHAGYWAGSSEAGCWWHTSRLVLATASLSRCMQLLALHTQG